MDNTTLAEVTWPTLTSVDLGSAERARMAAELLLERIEAWRASRVSVGVEPRLVVRASSGASRDRRPSRSAGRFPARDAAADQAGVASPAGRRCCLLIPALLPVVVLSVLPLARGIYLGFTDSQAGFEITRTSSGSTTSAG